MNALKSVNLLSTIAKQSWTKVTAISSFSTSSVAKFQNRDDDDSFALSRKFGSSETYQPHDLDEENYIRYLKQQNHKEKVDFFQVSGIDPLKHYKNPHFLSRYINQLGMIKPRSQTGLTAYNQKRLTKAIKRARAFGIIPTTYKIGFGAIGPRH
ncbi:ribosomal protein S18 [Conidiobolus coronatus NRRL 28638]|uniref:Small ribosomal subunit protein bS18m n=1 Tax=Conidiobolus coronatus (strain ATCC 28846 / CBS 209.66 / NRRL 28638) TaxID=796925 RepID=A0A137PJB1_CONC2|nr:ribosomal protein S18 [Conidiobolus coronatus NRRL 28638]|eukprot:KXN75088.1 ribosomal protein S18 [Conidiobolus coronatus NRRL 28638]